MFLNKKLLTIIGAAGLALGASACSNSGGGSVTGLCADATSNAGFCGSFTLNSHYNGTNTDVPDVLPDNYQDTLDAAELGGACADLLDLTAILDGDVLDTTKTCADDVLGSGDTLGTCAITVTFSGTEPETGYVIDSLTGTGTATTDSWETADDAQADCEDLDAGSDYTTSSSWTDAVAP